MSAPNAAPTHPLPPATQDDPAVLAFGAAMGVCVVLPWINPIASGPAPGVYPLVVSAMCAAMLALIYPLATMLHDGERLARVVAWSWLVAACASTLMGLVQYFGHAASLQPWLSQADPGMAYGNLRQRNQLATLIVMGMASLLFLTRHSRGVNLPGWGLLALLTMGAASTSSRTGLSQIIVLAALALLWRTRRDMALAVLLLYAAFSFALPWMLAQGGHQAESTFARIAQPMESLACHSRLTLWSNVLHLIAQHPWRGWGWGELDYAHFITLYDGPRFCEILDNAHNLPLHLAVELGVPAAVAVCGVLAWLVWRGKPFKEVAAHRQLAWTVLALIALHSLLEYPLWYGPFQMAFALCVLLLWRRKSPPPARPLPAAVALGAAIASATFALAAFAAWDYHRVSQLYLPQAVRERAYQTDTYDKVRGSRLFAQQVEFAELTTAMVTTSNASKLHTLSLQLLHFSPEPRVIERLIDSAWMLGLNEDAAGYERRYHAAFPQAYEQWMHAQEKPPTP